ncbi:hypothetical protein GCM10011342_06620 [Aquisalinus flavus]|uniref:Uncharacterized protein n=1 Tax=Aquisalinus flavus TaxID=1526572 RepID=A0A8J2V2A6_9PROT|nr:hypothetical protein GCM10011342_06620 [Aquisalinus flavus]
MHIGGAKCGSSALQAALTRDPVLARRDGSTVEYAAIDFRGGLIRHESLAARAGPYGYRSSPTESQLENVDPDVTRKQLAGIAHDVVLSNESWQNSPDEWAAFLENWRMPVHVVAYIRPQVPLLNSAWWQWGAWSGDPFNQWVLGHFRECQWYARLAPWRTLPYVETVTVRLVRGDIVPDFLENVLQADASHYQPARHNAALPASVLRLYQKNRHLRSGPHNSAIDFILRKHLSVDGSAPWVFDRAWIERIIEKSRADNERLADLLEPEMRNHFLEDPRWWDPAAFAHLKPESPHPQPLRADQLEPLCVELINSLVALEKRA